ncbi:hypothetical protein FLACOL_02027 [Flavobacterium columnare]|uniref:Uncharacterized protein n=1 Tax=Flavobacterium columnare TaxID=996 RepID=A0A2N9PCH1_9FLAO|nr:hypothetical protein FLACOL_02027 [Flavobacterium columnare]
MAATVIFPSESTLNGPVVTGVTLVLAEVTATPFNVSFVVTFPGTVTIAFVLATVTFGSFTATITFIGIGVLVEELLPSVGSNSIPVTVAVFT